MKDLTVIFLTQNEVPESWRRFHWDALVRATEGAALIVMSRKLWNHPGRRYMNLIQDKPRSLSNIYWQILRAAKMATTEYIAIAEDDTLYPREHFMQRPPKNCVGYNMCHWSLFTWGVPTYSWRNRRGNYSMIASRELVIEALEERFAKYPNGTPDNITGEIARPMVERNMGITLREAHEFETTVAVININHSEVASDDLQRRQRKDLGRIQAFDIPHWGRAEDLIKQWK